ncbi:MAG: 3-hydroxyacyl-CoA dehydrogenase [Alicyclobacillus mali]|uniref:3-hydroxyacyl-CoA dehydrogenase n=1 Tax=Alicyclobacillus mali (ex Roth et al. 2021) TaxID=1123961 RepID=UPI0023F06C77|nr:3-hydroxyacyl-CoA dehydrogenase [Alicyclobacillus mali (ex Roth et al. 2021)]MCL6487501.1 3-hydroxyacyl-CoA dehydrogenase [Alicyclobacillus mali (ex Roth et al. 2021)]
MTFRNITVAGGGVLGSQIAYQTAFHGFPVVIYDVSDEALAKVRDRLEKLKPNYMRDLGASQEQVDAAIHRIRLTSDLADAVREADLVIEAVPEIPDVKREFYERLGKVAPARTVFATNSSTLLPSQFAEATGRPEKFLALHFANSIWRHNTAEVMRHPGTDEQVFRDVIEFARAIGMVPLPLHKEQPGYILNSLLVPFLEAAQMLWVNEVADPETIDKTWMIATGAKEGPFSILDTVGIRTAYNIASGKAKSRNEAYVQLAEKLKSMIDQGKLGRESGEGFYRYPHPRFKEPDFLK